MRMAALGTLLVASVALGQNAAGPSAAPSSTTRACTANPVLPPPTSKKKVHAKTAVRPEPPPVCLEVKGEGIEVQEFLQNSVREAAWRIGENRASEDSWSFVRYFGPDDLDTYADTKVLLEPVKFTGGKAAVTARTTELPDGYTRVQVSARFVGDGSSTDKTWAQPTSTWSLTSKGVLEQELVSALQKRYRPVQ